MIHQHWAGNGDLLINFVNLSFHKKRAITWQYLEGKGIQAYLVLRGLLTPPRPVIGLNPEDLCLR